MSYRRRIELSTVNRLLSAPRGLCRAQARTDCVAGRSTLLWLTAWRDRDGGGVLTIHHVFDEGSAQLWDVAEFMDQMGEVDDALEPAGPRKGSWESG